MGASGLDGATNAVDAMGGQVVHDDDIAGPQGRGEDLFDVGPEGVAIHRSLEHHRSRHVWMPPSMQEVF